ncbi:MAG: mRNA interferase RelE/StbE [Verrucomicrobiales bacterium]|jgi:mRNA interferase RelE/StbE
MAKYDVRVLPKARKELQRIPKADRIKLMSRISALSDDPRAPGVKKLAGHDHRYRVRQGDYRILYDVSDKELTVMVIKVGQRGGFY